MTKKKVEFVETILNWFSTPSMGREIDVKFLEDAYDEVTKPHWISVKDELPPKESEYEDNSIVVLATDGNDVYKAIYQSNEYLSGWFTCDLWALDNITHWMSLPSVKHLNKE